MRNNRGFTLIELVVVIGIVSMLFGFVTINLIGTQKATDLTSTVDLIITDISMQQNKAMLGEGLSSGMDYGIHFESDKYILFSGSGYNPSDINNQEILIESDSIITNAMFPGGDLIFTSITGTVSGFLQGNDSVTIEDTSQTMSKTIIINSLGVVTQVN